MAGGGQKQYRWGRLILGCWAVRGRPLACEDDDRRSQGGPHAQRLITVRESHLQPGPAIE